VPKAASGLTARELEVLNLLARGMTARRIGDILNITKRTVGAHTQSILAKLGAANSRQAVAIALRDKIIVLH